MLHARNDVSSPVTGARRRDDISDVTPSNRPANYGSLCIVLYCLFLSADADNDKAALVALLLWMGPRPVATRVAMP